MNNIIEYSIPGIFFNNGTLTVALIELIKNKPNRFYDDFKITSVYGCPPIIWNGGRVLRGTVKLDDLKEMIKYYNSNNISVRWTFTNQLLEEKHLDDRYGNKILELTKENETHQNDVNIASEKLKKYIEEKYPEMKIVYSTTLCIKDIDALNKISKRYIIVPDYTINNDFEKLKQLEHPENIEILVNDTCRDNCPLRHKHYIEHSKSNLNMTEGMPCQFLGEANYILLRNTLKHHVKLEDIKNKYLPLGINKFKLAGRSSSGQFFVESILEYMVKPEFKDEIRWDLFSYIERW